MDLFDILFKEEKKVAQNSNTTPKRTTKTKLKKREEIEIVKKQIIDDIIDIGIEDLTKFENYMKANISLAFCVVKCDDFTSDKLDYVEKIFFADNYKLARSIRMEYEKLKVQKEIPLEFVVKNYIAKVNKQKWPIYDLIIKACFLNEDEFLSEKEKLFIAKWLKFKKINNK